VRASELRPDDVVVTGRGVVSPIGHSVEAVTSALQEGKCGIAFDVDLERMGLRCQVSGRIRDLAPERLLTDEQMLSMSRTSIYSSVAALDAVREAGLAPSDLEREETGVAIGCGIGSAETIITNAQKFLEQRTPRRIGAHGVDRTMTSTCAANASVLLRTRGIGEALSSACATGIHNIGYAARMIRHGYQDTMIAGAAEEDGWGSAHCFDAMRVLCVDSNDRPARASRPLDRTRSGFVPSGGAGVVVLESAERARARGARPLARIAGYASGTDGTGEMTAPSVEGQRRVVLGALRDARLQPSAIEYVNLHGTSTPTGDVTEVISLVDTLGPSGFLVSSSKSQIGHSLGAAGAIELVFCLAMLERGFVAPSISIEELDPLLAPHAHLVARETIPRPLRFVMTNNFGFGGTNGSMILERIEA